MNLEQVDNSRRQFLKQAVGLTALAMVGSQEAESKEKWNAETVHDAMGELVPYQLLKEKLVLPPANWQELLKSDTGIIVNLRYHRAFLFKDGTHIGTKVISGGSRPHYATTEGPAKIIWQSKHHKSREFNGANMDFSSFFNEHGEAFHASDNFKMRDGRSVAKSEHDVAAVRLDSSHGCVNMLRADAEEVFAHFHQGTFVYVLPISEGIDEYAHVLEDTYNTEQAIARMAAADVASQEAFHHFLDVSLPVTPYAHLLPEEIRIKVYGHFAPEGVPSDTNPVLRIRHEGIISNAIRITNDAVLVSDHGAVRMLYISDLERRFPQLPLLSRLWDTPTHLHGHWASLFGYQNGGEGQPWIPAQSTGVLLRFDEDTVALVTKDAHMVTAGAPVFVRSGGDIFTCTGTVRESRELGRGVYAHFLHTARELEGL